MLKINCRSRSTLLKLFLTAGILWTTDARSADLQQKQSASVHNTWTLIVSPYLWGASLKGSAALGGFNAGVDVPFGDTLKHLDFSAMGNVELNNGLLGIYLDGQYTKTTQHESLSTIPITAGAKVTSLAGGLFYRVYEQPLGGLTVFGRERKLAIEPTAGVRWTSLVATVEALGLSVTKKAQWGDPFVGTRVNVDLTDRWNLFVEGDVGGFGVGSSFSAQMQTYLGYRTFMFSRPTIVRLGYRALYQDYKTPDFTGNEFRWKVWQTGPVVGFSMIF